VKNREDFKAESVLPCFAIWGGVVPCLELLGGSVSGFSGERRIAWMKRSSSLHRRRTKVVR